MIDKNFILPIDIPDILIFLKHLNVRKPGFQVLHAELPAVNQYFLTVEIVLFSLHVLYIQGLFFIYKQFCYCEVVFL